jgi:hypothetical protein
MSVGQAFQIVASSFIFCKNYGFAASYPKSKSIVIMGVLVRVARGSGCVHSMMGSIAESEVEITTTRTPDEHIQVKSKYSPMFDVDADRLQRCYSLCTDRHGKCVRKLC